MVNSASFDRDILTGMYRLNRDVTKSDRYQDTVYKDAHGFAALKLYDRSAMQPMKYVRR